MQVRFLCGPAGSGKTFRCLAEVREVLRAAPEGPPLIFIAPKQSTFQLERQLLADGSIQGYTRLQILSFERLARLIFEGLNIAPPELLSEEGRIMVLRALLLKRESDLKLFRGSARRPGFALEISRLLAEFQQYQLSPSKVKALAESPHLRAELRDKLRDLALLDAGYAEWLAEHKLQDGNRLLDAATDLLRANSGNPAFHFSGLWLDGFAEMTPQELDLLAAVVPFCDQATLAFCLDEPATDSRLSIWNAVGKTFQQCRQRIEHLAGCQSEVVRLPRDAKAGRFARSSVLRELEEGWEADRQIGPIMGREKSRPPKLDARPGSEPERGLQAASTSDAKGTLKRHECRAPMAFHGETGTGGNDVASLRVVVCENAEGEAVFAAREILKFVRQGNRFRDCAVLVRNLEAFHKPLGRTFRRYGIPFFLDRREGVAHHPLAELTRNALRTAAFDWRHEDWFAALKAGFCSADDSEIDRLENESLARGWQGGRWRVPIRIPEDEELGKRFEQLRQKIIPPFEVLGNRLAEWRFEPDGTQLAETLREFWDLMRIGETLERRSAEEGTGAGSLQRPSVDLTVWEQMNLWLDNVALAFSKAPMTLRDWLPVLESGLASLTVGIIPPALDEVLIGAVDRARNPELKFCLVLGANESVFPAAPASPAILTDADRHELNQVVSFGNLLWDRLARERYYGYIAFTRAGERLAVAFSRSDADGKPLNPSAFVGRLTDLFPDLAVENMGSGVGLNEIVSVNELIPTLVHAAPGEFEDFRWSPMIAGLMKDLGALCEPDPEANLSAAMAEKLYGAVLKTSVSRLEEFAQCPFKFFIRSGLRAGERKLFELDARERGTFQHDVLKIFHEQVVAEKKRWRDLTPSQARERIGQIAAVLAADFREGLLRETPQSRFAARLMTESLQDFVEVIISWMRSQYQFDPAAVELDFGGEGSAVPAWEMDLGNGHSLALRGRIDRIDVCRDPQGDEALAVVLDYKSGGKKLEAILMEHGVQLQLAAYLNTLRHFKDGRELFGAGKLLPAGIFYVNLRGQFENGRTRSEVLGTAEGSRRAAYRHTGRFDAGALAKLDSAGAADQFNYVRNKDGELRKGSAEAMPAGELERLLDEAEEQLRRIGREIFSGRTSVDPYRKGRETPCDFCDYQSACRIDPWTHQFRVLAAREAKE